MALKMCVLGRPLAARGSLGPPSDINYVSSLARDISHVIFKAFLLVG